MGTGTAGLGDGGRPQAYPVITKGRGQGETPANVNMNYWLGIATTGVLAADFEDSAGGVNHPILGTTVVPIGQWHHIAVTYTGSCWQLYLDGIAETMSGTACPNATPESTSAQHAALATALQTNGTLPTDSGYFSGVIDEVRIWNRALTQQEISDNRFQELTAGTGLLGRWGLNENSGTTAANSISGSPAGTLTNGPAWVAGFPPPDTTQPSAPIGLNATPGSTEIDLTWTANTEPDLGGYNVYRSLNSGGPWGSPINGETLVSGTAYTDSGLTNGTPYFYIVTAVDTSDNESDASNEATATPVPAYGSALKFNGTNQHVTFGAAPGLGVTTFTLEAWVKRAAGGATMSTGSNGLDGSGGRPVVYPVLTKGMGENDTPANVNMNWFLGITSTGVIGADFEDNAGGVNRPAWGTTVVPIGEWHHIAATYGPTGENTGCWKLYLDGNLETLNAAVTGCPNATPESSSIQHAALATGINSTGVLATGFFSGSIDNARVWNIAIPETEIQDNMYAEIPCNDIGLIGHWKMNEGSGATIANSVIGGVSGALTNGPLWTAGKIFAKGDLDCDCDVDGSDIVAFVAALPPAVYDAAADFNNDLVIDAADLEILAGKFGKSDCPSLVD